MNGWEMREKTIEVIDKCVINIINDISIIPSLKVMKEICKNL